MHVSKEITDTITERYLSGYDKDYVRPYVDYFLSKWPDSIEAIVFYGSCLSEGTKKETSTPDFFILTESYGKFHKNLIHSILNAILPPNTYSICSSKLKGKYNVLSIRDFQRETSLRAKDIYNLGRLSKRTALLYTRNDEIKEMMINSFAGAYSTVATKSIFLMPEVFSLDDFIKKCLRISYIGEHRVEADDKISKLLDSERQFYTSIYASILKDLVKLGRLKEGDGIYVQNGTEKFPYKLKRCATKIFLRKSVIRAKLRWPKSIYTFKGWADVLIAKIERAKGIKIKLSEKEKKYPLIYGWKYYFKLKKDKMIK